MKKLISIILISIMLVFHIGLILHEGVFNVEIEEAKPDGKPLLLIYPYNLWWDGKYALHENKTLLIEI